MPKKLLVAPKVIPVIPIARIAEQNFLPDKKPIK